MQNTRARSLVFATLALVTISAGAAVALASPIIKLDTRRVLPIADQVSGAALGDFDEDGKTDVAVVHSSSSNGVDLFRGLGAGRYTPAGSILIGTLGRPTEIVAADLNHDRHLDLVMTGLGAALIVALGNGGGGFGTPVAYGSTQRSDDLALADFNGDSHLDAVVTHVFINNVSVFPGTGTGAFGPEQSIPIGSASFSVVTGDFKVDGHVDIAVTAAGVIVLPGNGAGGFGPPVQSVSGSSPVEMVAADMDEDGRLDLAAADRIAGSVLIFQSAGDGSFSLMRTIPVISGIDALAVGDLNADGHSDIVAGGVGDQVHVLLATGPAQFGGFVAYRAGSFPDTLLIADLDEDGRQDVLAGNTLGREVAILPGNGVGVLAQERSIPLSFSQTPDLAAADFNEDGRVDLAALNSEGPFIFECTAAGPLDCGPGMLLKFLPRTGPATFGPATDSPTRCAPEAMAVADFDRDGHLDIATANRGARDAFGICYPASLSILRGDGHGGFAFLVDLLVADEPDKIAAGDLNEDGFPDLVVTYGIPQSLRVYLGGPGGAIIQTFAHAFSSGPRDLAVTDLNDDGHLDVAVTVPAFGFVAIMRGDGTGQLTPIAECASGPGGGATGPISVGDFDGDGDLDLATVVPSSLRVMHRVGGAFCIAPSDSIPIPAGASGLAAGDFDNDGGLDLVVPGGGSRVTTVKGGQLLVPAEADAFGAYSSQAVVTADFDDDGLIDVAAPNGRAISLVRSTIPVAQRLLLSLDNSEIEWLGVLDAVGYDIVRGDLGALRATRGDFTTALETCVANDVLSTSVTVPENPASGKVWWFVARPLFADGPGTYDSGGPGQVGSRDAEIAASPLACP